MAGTRKRVPAGELESLLARLQAFLLDPASIHDALDPLCLDAAILGTVIERAHELAGRLDAPVGSLKATLRDNILRVELRSESVLLVVDMGLLLLDGRYAATIEFVIPSRMIRRTSEVRLIVPPHGGRRSRVDAGLVKLLVRARQVRLAFENCGAMPLSQFAATLGYQLDYRTVLLKLAYLSPSIVQAILDGQQPPALSRQYLARCTSSASRMG